MRHEEIDMWPAEHGSASDYPHEHVPSNAHPIHCEDPIWLNTLLMIAGLGMLAFLMYLVATSPV